MKTTDSFYLTNKTTLKFRITYIRCPVPFFLLSNRQTASKPSASQNPNTITSSRTVKIQLCHLLGIRTGDVLIIVHWKLSTLIYNLTWIGKPPTSTGEVYIIRDRENIQYKYIEDENHFTLSLFFSSHHSLLSLSLSLILLSNNTSIYRHQW